MRVEEILCAAQHVSRFFLITTTQEVLSEISSTTMHDGDLSCIYQKIMMGHHQSKKPHE